MDPDIMLVIGLVIGILAVPSLVSALQEDRAPRVGVAAVLVAGALIVLAVNDKPGGYRLKDVPDAVYHVIGRVMR